MEEQYQGRIYMIKGLTSGKQYIGSTCSSSIVKKSQYKSAYNQWKKGNRSYTKAFDIIDEEDWQLIIIEEYLCKNRDELQQREQYWIDTIEGGCINTNKAFLSEEDTRKLRYETTYKWQNTLIHCECGEEVKQGSIKTHLTTQKHKRGIILEQNRQPIKWKKVLMMKYHHL